MEAALELFPGGTHLAEVVPPELHQVEEQPEGDGDGDGPPPLGEHGEHLVLDGAGAGQAPQVGGPPAHPLHEAGGHRPAPRAVRGQGHRALAAHGALKLEGGLQCILHYTTLYYTPYILCIIGFNHIKVTLHFTSQHFHRYTSTCFTALYGSIYVLMKEKKKTC